MPTQFIPFDRGQDQLVPPSLKEWMAPDDLAFFVDELVEEMDLHSFYAPYLGDGRRNRPYDPAMMVRVLIYAYASGIFSSRKIARALHRDIGFRWLSGGNFPDHRTICRFRLEHLEAFESLFVLVVRLGQSRGYIGLKTLAVDGTKVRANASKRKAMSRGRMVQAEEELRAEVRELLRRADEADAEDFRTEDADCSVGSAGDEVRAEAVRKQQRLDRIGSARKELEDRLQAEAAAAGRPDHAPSDKAQINFTDSDSRIMPTSTEGFQQSYNAQIAVDADSQLVVAIEVGQQSNDHGQLVPMLDKVEENLGSDPEALLADAGYRKEADFRTLEERGVDAHVALGREGRKFAVNPKRRPATRRMADKLATPEGQRAYARRKWIAEAPFGWIKEVLGFRRFSLRGLHKVRREWHLVCLALNIKRMHSMADC